VEKVSLTLQGLLGAGGQPLGPEGGKGCARGVVQVGELKRNGEKLGTKKVKRGHLLEDKGTTHRSVHQKTPQQNEPTT